MVEHDGKDREHHVTIENYKNAYELRFVAERYLAVQLAKDLEDWETKESSDHPERF
jgi:hypothetical protein